MKPLKETRARAIELQKIAVNKWKAGIESKPLPCFPAAFLLSSCSPRFSSAFKGSSFRLFVRGSGRCLIQLLNPVSSRLQKGPKSTRVKTCLKNVLECPKSTRVKSCLENVLECPKSTHSQVNQKNRVQYFLRWDDQKRNFAVFKIILSGDKNVKYAAQK